MSQTPTPPDHGPPSQGPLPPAGWYEDHEPGMLRYWDGTTWTEHRAPLGGQHPPAAASAPEARGDTKWAWVLASTPAIFLVMNVVAWLTVGPGGGAEPALNAAGIGLVIGLVLQDSKALQEAGVRVSKWWGILLPPVYLILRTVRARSSVGVPILWFALMVGYVVGSGTVLYAVDSGTATASAPGATSSAGVPQPGPTTAPAEPAPSDAVSPAPAPFTPTASVEHIGGASVRFWCWPPGAGEDGDWTFGRHAQDVWAEHSADCSPTQADGYPSPRQKRALRRAFPDEPVDARNLGPLYGICGENDGRWLEEMEGPEVTWGMVGVVEAVLMLCPKHPQRARAERLLAEAEPVG